MADTATRGNENQRTSRTGGRRLPTPAAGSARAAPVRRRWGRVAAGGTLALLGGWVSVSLYVTAGDRVEVVAVADDVARFDTLTSDDLRTVRVAADRDVQTISGGELDDLVGRITAVELVEGTLLSPGQLMAEEEPLVTTDEAVVAVELGPNEVAESVLNQGTAVRVVIAAGGQGNDTGEPRPIPGWVLSVGSPDERSRSRQVEVVVSRLSAPDVAVAASEGRVQVVADGAI